MTPHKQLFRHKPEDGIFGDCVRSAIACLLDVHPSEVPHEHRQSDNGEQRARMEAWLRPRGYTLASIAFNCGPEEVMRCMKGLNPGMLYLLSGTSRTGCNHVVICKDDGIVWDTSLDNSGIIGPCDDGMTWVEFLCSARAVAA